MGANVSSYPHSCSPRFGGNTQAQQTFVGVYLNNQAKEHFVELHV